MYILRYNHSPLYFSLVYNEGRSEGGNNYFLGHNHFTLLQLGHDKRSEKGVII